MPRPKRESRIGMIQVYTGDGKGKSTAALGLGLRAVGQGLRVCMVQFMKGKTNYGELRSVRKLRGFTIKQFGRPDFVDKRNPHPEDFRGAQQALAFALDAMHSRRCDILILDELNVAAYFKLVSLKQVLTLLAAKPAAMELVLTGRYAHKKILAAAGLVTEMKEIKHYYRQGTQARTGIEF